MANQPSQQHYSPSFGLARPSIGKPKRSFGAPSSPGHGSSPSSRPPQQKTHLDPAQDPNSRRAVARKTSFNQLTSNSASVSAERSDGLRKGMAPTTPASRSAHGREGDLEVGDAVDVPGGMHGTVRFVGNVKGKAGVFAGVELSREFAQRGKNDGTVDGTRYFSTSMPNSGIFLPINRASKRASPTISSDSFPSTPTSPSGIALHQGAHSGQHSSQNAYTPPTPSVSKLSQSVGPGRAPSPFLKPKSRPSLPRPESPLRKQQNMLATPAARPSVSNATSAKPAPRYAPSPTPGKIGSSFKPKRNSASSSYVGDPGKKMPTTLRPAAKVPGGARSESALEVRSNHDSALDNAPIGIARTSNGSHGSLSNFPFGPRGIIPGHGNDEVERLREQLGERDRQLKEQAASLAEMENSLMELQSLIPSNGSEALSKSKLASPHEDAEAAQLRAMLREKNEKIAMLTAELDAHRADFRSTIDTLELASTETERVYEKRVEELLHEVRELQERSEDVDSVAQQLKQLEELVQELEEGLEDARRGEAEARGEVEFLRGEVERGRSELRREREKAAAALKGAGAAVNGQTSVDGAKEVEQRDDEIRGLKAIIHSLSRDSVPDNPVVSHEREDRRTSIRSGVVTEEANKSLWRQSLQLSEERTARESLEREMRELRGLIERKSYREGELERELEKLRKGLMNGEAGSRSSQTTVTPSNPHPDRDAKDRPSSLRPYSHKSGQLSTMETMPEGDTYSSDADGSALWCEICETGGHDILTCTNMFGNQAAGAQQHEHKAVDGYGSRQPGGQRTGRDAVLEGLKNFSTPSPRSAGRDGAGRSRRGESADVDAAPAGAEKASARPISNPLEPGMVAGKSSMVIDPDKWCALCERDGHESVDCPFEDAF